MAAMHQVQRITKDSFLGHAPSSRGWARLVRLVRTPYTSPFLFRSNLSTALPALGGGGAAHEILDQAQRPRVTADALDALVAQGRRRRCGSGIPYVEQPWRAL